MKKILFTAMLLTASLTLVRGQEMAEAAAARDTIPARYVMNRSWDDAYVFHSNLVRSNIYVNEEITTHLVCPESIKLVDISTKKIIGNQCADNIVRLKPSGRMYDRELIGTITVIGERHLAQYNVIYTKSPVRANAIYKASSTDMRQYTNPGVLMPEAQMANYAWAIYGCRRKYNGITASANGIRAVVNNIYTINDYFFIDFSLYNSTKIKYDIEEMRIKLTDKKEARATNSQTIELRPVFTLNKATSFRRGYRNVIVIQKLTFPDEKLLRLEISENQISGRVIYIPIAYEDILNADSFDERLLKRLPFEIKR